MTRSFEQMSRAELIRGFKKLQNAQGQLAAHLDEADPKRVIYELQVHQFELEMQNRELQEAQRSLEESRSRYADLYDFAPVAYCTLSPEGYIQEINLTGALLLEASRDTLIGKSFRSIAVRKNPHLFQEHMKRCAGEKARVTSELTLNLRLRGRRVVQIISDPIRNQSGVTTAYWTALVDISEMKQLESDLQVLATTGEVLVASLDYTQTLEAAARIVVPSLADLLKIDLVNDDGVFERLVVVFADAAKQKSLGQRMKEFAPKAPWKTSQGRVIAAGKPVLLAELSDVMLDRIAQDDAHADALRAAGIRSMMVLPLTARGQTFGAMTFAFAESGRRYSSSKLQLTKTIASRFAMAIDNARLYARAKKAISARDAILGVVSHDLGNPLSLIIMTTSSMLNSRSSQRRKDAAAIQRATDTMTMLIRDLLDVSRIEAGELKLEKKQCPVRPIVDEALEILRPLAARKSLRLEVHSPTEGGLNVDCDQRRIQQVLSNLVGNAIKFTGAGGEITVRIEHHLSEACISVADSGVGISSSDLPHIFDRFWKADKFTGKGAGLGLSIAKGIVEANGGRIWAESQLGVGSTFFFTLPLASSDEEHFPTRPRLDLARARERTDDQQTAQSGTARKVVLVVDDDANTRDLLQETLEHKGYDVVTCENGAEALQYLRRTSVVSCILLDLQMPVMDGWTFLTARNRDPALRPIPVVVVSSRPNLSKEVEAEHAIYLQKPVSPESLVEAMRQAECISSVFLQSSVGLSTKVG